MSGTIESIARELMDAKRVSRELKKSRAEIIGSCGGEGTEIYSEFNRDDFRPARACFVEARSNPKYETCQTCKAIIKLNDGIAESAIKQRAALNRLRALCK